MKAAALIVLLAAGLLFAPRAAAGEVAFEFGPDVVHAPGLRVVSVSIENESSRFRLGSFGQDGVSVEFVSVEYMWRKFMWRPVANCRPSVGIAHIDNLTPLSGTHWNFIVGCKWQLSDKVFVSVVHLSHGRALGIEPNKTNKGFNFLTFGTSF